MKKLYEKDPLTFAIVYIAVYCLLQSLANPVNEMIGIEYAASAVFCILQAAAVFCFIKKNRLSKQYGLCRPLVPARRFLYYVPLFILVTGNLWNGAAINLSPAGTVCYIVCMLCVGFLEEVLVRGFLFKAIAKDNVKTAVLVSSVAFGLGHLLNLINGSGMGLAENLFQVTWAIVIGFLFVLLFDLGGSLLPCIITHSAINITSAFANETGLTAERQMLFHAALFVIAAAYAVVLIKTFPKKSGY